PAPPGVLLVLFLDQFRLDLLAAPHPDPPQDARPERRIRPPGPVDVPRDLRLLARPPRVRSRATDRDGVRARDLQPRGARRGGEARGPHGLPRAVLRALRPDRLGLGAPGQGDGPRVLGDDAPALAGACG